MKITKKEILEKFGLKEGDIVRFKYNNNYLNIIKVKGDNIYFEALNTFFGPDFNLTEVIENEFEFEIVNMNGVWENARCKTHIDCKECPLRVLSCSSGQKRYEETENKRLKDVYSTMKRFLKESCEIEDDTIYPIIDNRLKELIKDETLRKIVEQSVEE